MASMESMGGWLAWVAGLPRLQFGIEKMVLEKITESSLSDSRARYDYMSPKS